ncbi:MAG: hypothetical protein K6G03_06805 [Lachnospiraceae bacterium]|nr:hypothetical protein [Lachnospiraceae bacterium]
MKKKTIKHIAIICLLVCVMILSSCGLNKSNSDSSTSISKEDATGNGFDTDSKASGDTDDLGSANKEDGNVDDLGSDYEGSSDSDVSPETEAVKALFYDVFSTMKSDAMDDTVRLAEVNPEMTPVSLYDDSYNTYTEEIDVYTIEMDGHKMQYTVDIYGEPDENGLYPLYIALHGGGSTTVEDNNSNWLQMRDYYSDSVTNGIYVTTRGMEDVWNLHFLDYSYAMYDRLIEDMVLLGNADPNRVYLLGFSAGGDGVYAIAPRMADRFAAVNMSSGHPNGVSLLNTASLPFQIQVGIRDFYSEDAMRSLRGAEFEKTFNEYHETFNFGYPHSVLVHVPNGHNYNDYSRDSDDNLVLTAPAEFAERCAAENWLDRFMAVYSSLGYDADISGLSYAYGDEVLDNKLMDLITNDLGMDCSYDTNTNAIDYVSSYTRDPAPEKLVWDLSTRAPGRKDSSFYWLKADQSVNKGVIFINYNKDNNSVEVWTDGNVNGSFSILATPFLMDFKRPLTIITPNGEYTKELKADKDVIEASIKETGDMYLGWAQEIPINP